MQNNPYIKILERALNIVQTEVVRISVEHLQLDNLLEERLVNIKLAVDYTSLLALEIEKKISLKYYAFTNLSIFEFRKLNLKILTSRYNY